VAAILRLAENELSDYEVQQAVRLSQILKAKLIVLQSDDKYCCCIHQIACAV
jgi:hypothetical protein